MNVLETLAAKAALSRLRAKVGETNMSKVAGYAVMVAGAAAVLSGVACLMQHFAAGDLMATAENGMAHYQSCLALIMGGGAAFSPGLGKLKVDR